MPNTRCGGFPIYDDILPILKGGVFLPNLIKDGELTMWNELRQGILRFWKGEEAHGGHAIAIVGYDEDGFIIRNSWGSYYADGGYTKFPYEDYDYFVEVWTIID